MSRAMLKERALTSEARGSGRALRARRSCRRQRAHAALGALPTCARLESQGWADRLYIVYRQVFQVP